MAVREALLKDLQRQVQAMVPPLTERVAEDAGTAARLRTEWERARKEKRIAATYESWFAERVTQVAVAWVLGTVFLRFCEDNGLVELPFLSGPGDRLTLAQERQDEFIHAHPSSTDRDWILAGFAEMSKSPVAAGLFDRTHNPMWHIELPHHAAKALLEFWRRRGEDGEVVHDFTDDGWDTRFLGDLYQDLSEEAKTQYVLLQTPEFVEEFILDYTLEPAIEEFGLTTELRTIDPTCGSGHFLLGLFHRLISKWRGAEPDTDTWTLIRRALNSVHGVDKNPFAAAIARFRLLVAVVKQAGERHLASAPVFPLHIAVGDSLLHGLSGPCGEFEHGSAPRVFSYRTEDIETYLERVHILREGTYHVVVGNPPASTVKDRQEYQNYRKVYKSCSGTYALSVPFSERLFRLARPGDRHQGAGFVGQITPNSFMKREFGKKLIEDFFRNEVDLTHVIDTSGAHIPGHGIPTVILIGRNQAGSTAHTIRTVMGIRGEPSPPENAAEGKVWSAIRAQIVLPGSESEWVGVSDLPRHRFMKHPWSLSGGGAEYLIAVVEASTSRNLGDLATRIGYTALSGADDVYTSPGKAFRRKGIATDSLRSAASGSDIRDFTVAPRLEGLIVRNTHGTSPTLTNRELAWIWPYRALLVRRTLFGTRTYLDSKRGWQEWNYLSDMRNHPRLVTFSLVATHNQFAVVRDDILLLRSAPAITFTPETQQEVPVNLTALLNSSTACFWLKQVSHSKGQEGYRSGRKSEAWEQFFSFVGTALQEFPLPSNLPAELARRLDSLATRIPAMEPSTICVTAAPTRERLDRARAEHEQLRRQMVALQEELDWEVYQLYGLLSEVEATELRANPEDVPELEPGQRAFEIAMARKVAAGELETQWFTRQGATPIIELPQEWSEGYRKVVEARIKAIEWRRDIGLIERPENKRRWSTPSWEQKEQEAPRNWLLDRGEDRSLWFTRGPDGTDQPKAQTVNQLADKLRSDPEVATVARLYAGSDRDFTDVLAEVVAEEHVPYLAQLRYKEPGLAKRKQWEEVWDQQREEDRLTAEQGKQVWLDVSVPPRYASADFLKPSYWRHRGKLDVPKERFISYPHASPETDESLLLGWAGWDHKEQALALTTLIEDRSTRNGWDTGRMTPLIAGLAEVMPWVRQWHGDIDPTHGQSWAASFDTYLETKQHEHGLSTDDLRAWRAPKNKGGRPRKHPRPSTSRGRTD